MKPYYQQSGVTIYHGDCRDVLPEVAADLIVTDPPYGIADAPISSVDRADGKRGPRGGFPNTWHPPSDWDKALDPSWLPLALAVAPVAMFGHWRKRRAFEDVVGMEPRAEIVWVKDTHVGPPCPVAMRDERIWIWSAASIRPNHFETSAWEAPIIPTWGHRWHKNEKPLALMKRLVAWLPGLVVLDPFMGSGTTLRAAKDLGREAIGVEIDESHCEAAAKRLSQEVLPFAVNR